MRTYLVSCSQVDKVFVRKTTPSGVLFGSALDGGVSQSIQVGLSFEINVIAKLWDFRLDKTVPG